MRRLHLLFVVLLLTAVGLSVAWYKYQTLGFPLTPDRETETWTVEAQIGVKPGTAPASVRFALPTDPPHYTLLDEGFVSRGWGLTTQSSDRQRESIWTKRNPAGNQTLYYQATVYRDQEEIEPSPYPGPATPPKLEEPLKSAAESFVEEIRAGSADIQTFATLLVKEVNASRPDENIAAFLKPDATETERTRLAIQLLAIARIPARMAHGVMLTDEGRNLTPTTWLEVHNSRRWVPIDPRSGAVGYPRQFLVWWHGDRSALTTSGLRDMELTFATTRNARDAVETAQLQSTIADSRLMDFSLLDLPIDTQNTYRILLLVPLGALIIVLLRNVIGIRTFGTFMPVLIALSFRETQLVAGVVLFTLIVALGLAIRFYLERLKLLLVPRLAAVVIVVILLMALISVVSHRLELDIGLSVGLFPMVILAMTIERVSIVWEEHGPGDALAQAAGSLVVAALAYLVMVNAYVTHLFFVFPELLLVVLAVTLLVGRYTGYRLTELFRFRAFKTLAQARRPDPPGDTPPGDHR
ncbi:MAG: inactive transglutaminase family protein [Guyparkeria sp.]|uniref:inactive transglutaminase family protein n=1 Tax=Guyparkeria sp. TaxID=2035736 RepID=UPI003978AA0E